VLALAAADQDVRHNLIATVTYPLNPSLELTLVGRATSGAPYTPVVQNDINGDGARNDRAFVFDPADAAVRAARPAVAAGMDRLLAEAPASARECLRAQFGAVAGRNSCRGPWVPGVDFQLNYKPDRFGLKRRLTLSRCSSTRSRGSTARSTARTGCAGGASRCAPTRTCSPCAASTRPRDATRTR
jgi:hypothetical protein